MAKKKKDERDRDDAQTRASSCAAGHRDIKLPRRQPPGGYVLPELPLRHIPTPF
jgi:hypothetical protein